MHDIVVQQSIMLICKALKHLCNSKKGLKRSATLNDNLSMIFYTYKKETTKNNLPYQCLQFFLRSWSLNQMILKCSLIHYGMIMSMIKVEKCSSIEDLLGLNVFLIIWKKK